ncbi:MAG: DEAD/DEAH box helicase family protein [Clostridia bacterium]|nr:DEAD/DEAH box helicase family protein [Clostridia bacterium]
MIVVKYKDNNIILEVDYHNIDSLKEMLDNKNYKYSYGDSTTPTLILPIECVYNLNSDLTPFKNELEIDQSFVEWKNKNINVKTPVLIRCGVITSKIYKGSYDIPHKDIEDVCKYFFKPAVKQQRYIDKKWDGYIHLYKKWLHEFPTGLLNDVCGVLEKHNIPYVVEYTYEQKPKRQFDWKPKDLFQLEPDQIEAIEAAMKGLRGVVKAPTGFGKTAALARYLTAYHGVPTLFIANKKTLLDDAAEDFKNGIEGLNADDVIQIKDGWFGKTKITGSTRIEDIKPLDAPIIVATIQSLSARLKDERTQPYLIEWLHDKCKFVMVDETQAVGTKIWDEVLNEVYAPYRIFLSATPRRTDGATLKLFAGSGPLLFTTTAEEQIKKGRLCELDIEYRVFDHKAYNENDADIQYSDEYKYRIVENEERNLECIVRPAIEMINEGRHILVLIQLIEHGLILKEMFLQNGLDPDDIRFIWGETPDKIRQSAINEFRKGNFKVMIGSTIFDAGVNIPIISGVILTGAGNSDITLVQRIGRGARNCNYEDVLGYMPEFMKQSDGKKITKVIDVMDINVKFFHKQAKNRYYNSIQEFGKDRVHIVGGDSSVLSSRKKRTTANNVNIDQYAAQFEMLKQFTK